MYPVFWKIPWAILLIPGESILWGDDDADGVVNVSDREPDFPVMGPAITDAASLELWKAFEEAKLQYEKERLEIAKEYERLERERKKEEMINGFIVQVESGLKHLNIYEDNLKVRKSDVEDLKYQEQLINKAEEKVRVIKYNPRLPVAAIKSQVVSLILDALDLESSAGLDVSDLDNKEDLIAEVNELITGNEGDKEDYASELVSIGNVLIELEKLAAERSNVIVATKSFQNKNGGAEYYKQSEDLRLKLNDLLQYFEQRDPQIVERLWYTLKEIEANSFKKTHYSRAQKDEVVFEVALSLKSGVDAGSASSVKIEPISIPVYGGFKINTSVGISFAQFLDPVQDYYIKDGAISENDSDVFLPFITSFMHFYFQGRRPLALGGSLGVGIPLGGSTGFESASFFLGPSLFIGSANRLIVNAGVMGGKVERLGAGYQAGDVLPVGQTVVPVQSRYDIGLYFGLSFNLGK